MPPPPDLPLLQTHHIAVDGGHVLQVQEFGRADGLPAVLLHGGPGSACTPLLRQGFDPEAWRVVCIDQRGCGGSQPRGQTAHNTTAHLVDDMRLVRRQLGLARWLVMGGSWGATLALAYAAAEPQALLGLLLRASFLGRQEDIDDFFGPAAGALRPRAWQRLHEAVSAPLLPTLAHALQHGTRAEQEHAATAWWRWEQALGNGQEDPPPLQGDALARQVDRLRVQAHYLVHGCWLAERPLLDLCATLPPVPTLLIHARDDLVCPAAGALALLAALPHAGMQWLAQGGHDASHPALLQATAAALDCFAAHGRFVEAA